MNIEQEIQNILDRNFTRGDNAKALKELLVLYSVSDCRCKEPVKCINCDEMVVMVSTGEFCPSCYC